MEIKPKEKKRFSQVKRSRKLILIREKKREHE
jgi:hypothetical protein